LGVEGLGKVAASLKRRRNNAGGVPTLAELRALVVEEEEGAVAAAVEFRQRHRPAERAAVGVLVELALLEPAAIAEEVVGVERLIAEIVVHRSVPLVCAGPCCYIDERGRRVPIFRIE